MGAHCVPVVGVCFTVGQHDDPPDQPNHPFIHQPSFIHPHRTSAHLFMHHPSIQPTAHQHIHPPIHHQPNHPSEHPSFIYPPKHPQNVLCAAHGWPETTEFYWPPPPSRVQRGGRGLQAPGDRRPGAAPPDRRPPDDQHEHQAGPRPQDLCPHQRPQEPMRGAEPPD